MKTPEGDRLQDAVDMWHNDSWSCPGGKPNVTVEQLAHALVVLDDWFRDRFFEPRREYRSKPVKPKQKRVDGVTSSEVPQWIRDAVLARDEWTCTHCGIAIDMLHYSLHHRRPKGMGGSRRLHTMANLVTLCGSGVDGCHGVVERDRPTSRRTGWLVPNGKTPEQWPVQRRTPDGAVGWWQPGDRWVEAEPHPDQVEDDEGAVA